MMDLQFIKIKIEEQIAVLTLDNPPVNILTPKVIEEIDSVFRELEDNPQVKVIVFTSAGANAFIAGADIKVIGQIHSAAEAEKLALMGQGVFSRIENSKKVTIAAIHGVCVGGG